MAFHTSAFALSIYVAIAEIFYMPVCYHHNTQWVLAGAFAPFNCQERKPTIRLPCHNINSKWLHPTQSVDVGTDMHCLKKGDAYISWHRRHRSLREVYCRLQKTFFFVGTTQTHSLLHKFEYGCEQQSSDGSVRPVRYNC